MKNRLQIAFYAIFLSNIIVSTIMMALLYHGANLQVLGINRSAAIETKALNGESYVLDANGINGHINKIEQLIGIERSNSDSRDKFELKIANDFIWLLKFWFVEFFILQFLFFHLARKIFSELDKPTIAREVPTKSSAGTASRLRT